MDTVNLTLVSFSHTNISLLWVIYSRGRGWVRCYHLPWCNGNRLLNAVSSVLSLIGQKVHITLWPVQTAGPSCRAFYIWLVISDHRGLSESWEAYCCEEDKKKASLDLFRRGIWSQMCRFTGKMEPCGKSVFKRLLVVVFIFHLKWK